MNLNDFKAKCDETMIEKCKCSEYLSLGFIGEVGEICETVKKFIREDFDEEHLDIRLTSEVGDVLWYHAMLMKYVFETDYPEDWNNLIENSRNSVLTTETIFKLASVTSSISENIFKTDAKIHLIDKMKVVMTLLAKIADLSLSQDTVITKLAGRKVANTISGDGEGIDRGES